MEKEFVPYELALRLKALRFNEPCISSYQKSDKHNFDVQYPCGNIYWHDQEHCCSAPTFSQAFRWFWENHKLHSHTRPFFDFDGNMLYSYEILIVKEGRYNNDCCTDVVKTIEEAELACLEKLIEIVEGIESQK